MKLLPEKIENCDIYVDGGQGWDGVMVALEYFPMMIGLSFAAIFLFLGIVFRSVVIPIRTVFTISGTIETAHLLVSCFSSSQ